MKYECYLFHLLSESKNLYKYFYNSDKWISSEIVRKNYLVFHQNSSVVTLSEGHCDLFNS